ncbi:hypothetical protein ABIF86_000316 [Bradyrhizobium japonicum]
MWRQVSSMARFSACRIQCLILGKACSIGFRSGEYGGRYHSLAPAAWINGLTSLRLVASEIVENDNVAFAQVWQEKVLDIGAEAFARYRPVEDARCGELVGVEGAEEREGAPVTVRGEAAQACPFGPPAL